MRTPRTQGATQRSTRRDRILARRSERGAPGDLTTELETCGRLAGAIVFETFALAVWNIGTRAPLTVLQDIARSVRSRRGLVSGMLSFVVGLVFVAAATVLLLPAVYDVGSDFVPLEIFTFLAALAIEYLIGGELRGAISRLAGTPRPN